MPGVRLSPDYFSGSGKLWDKKKGLSFVMSALARELALTAGRSVNADAMTDNSTGTAASSYAAIVVAPAKFDASSAGGAQLSGFNTSIGKVRNAIAVLAAATDGLASRIGLPAMTTSEGTIATPGTVPALDKTVTSASGTSAISHASYVATAKATLRSLAQLVRRMNGLAVATGQAKRAANLQIILGALPTTTIALAVIPAGSAAAASPNSISVSKADADAFLLAVANVVATLTAHFNAMNTAIKAATPKAPVLVVE